MKMGFDALRKTSFNIFKKRMSFKYVTHGGARMIIVKKIMMNYAHYTGGQFV